MTTSIVVSVHLDAPVSEVWASLSDVRSHVAWMSDAESITITSTTSTGVDTTFDCVTRIGLIRLNDKMRITEWVDGERMSVRHSGIVTGVGTFTLTPAGSGTDFSWSEDLKLPLYFGGPLGEIMAKPLLTAIWRKNLSALAATFNPT